MTSSPDQPHIVRARISKEMAFPIGFEFLREQCKDIAQWSEVHLYFSAHPTTFTSEFARILRAREPYPILRVERRPEEFSPYRPARWCFTVYPVERRFKSVARAALLPSAMETIRNFVSHVPTHANYYNRCEVLFDLEASTCTAQVLWEI